MEITQLRPKYETIELYVYVFQPTSVHFNHNQILVGYKPIVSGVECFKD